MNGRHKISLHGFPKATNVQLLRGICVLFWGLNSLSKVPTKKEILYKRPFQKGYQMVVGNREVPLSLFHIVQCNIDISRIKLSELPFQCCTKIGHYRYRSMKFFCFLYEFLGCQSNCFADTEEKQILENHLLGRESFWEILFKNVHISY